MNKVLIVDDKTENLYLLQSILDSHGFRVISAKNGAEALGLMRNNIPDLIIADILMPVMDGFTLCRECKKDKIFKNIPFFFYTATYVDAKDEEYALGLGADRFILKPQEPDVFLKIIKDFLEEVKNKTIHPKKIIQQAETVVLKEYNEVLIRKIEDKILQSEKAEKELRRYSEELEKEILERKKNEASLEKSEEYNRLLFNSSPIGLALCRMDGSLVDINPAFAKIIGRSIEETLKLTYWDITPEKYALQEAEQLKILEETGRYGMYEKEYTHKDGHLVPVLLQGLILDRDGERFIWSTVEDITKRKLAESALRESEERFRALYNDAVIGLYRTSPRGVILLANKALVKMLGFQSFDELSARDLNETGYGPTYLRKQFIDKIEKEGEVKNMESIWICRDGKEIFVRESAKAICDSEGKILYFDGIVEDITESKRAADALNKIQHLFETLAQVSPVGIFRTTAGGNTTYVNPKWSELSGLTLEEAAGDKWLDAVHPDDREKVKENWKSNILSKRPSDAEYRFLRKDGSVVWVIGNAVPEWINNEISGYIGTVTDITKIKQFEIDLTQAKEKAEENDKLKTAFLHNISHEVRTPMNAIIGFSDLIIDPDLVSETRNEFIQTIVQASHQLLSIITQIINMATIEVGQVKIYEKEISLNSVFKMLSDQFSSEADKKNINLKFNISLPDGEDKIRTDETKLIQILSNLIGNALKFIRQGSINSGYSLKGNFLEFYIKDTGIGIPANMHEKIFERFRQVESTLSREYEGSGLGLCISKAYVELLGGKIWLTSQPGEGSVFYFTIPYNKRKADIKPTEIASQKPKKETEKPVTILVTEDVDNNYLLLAQYLSNANFDVIRAENGFMAVEICRRNRQIHLVLMDLKMPVMDGFEATKIIKNIRPDLPVIAQTAYARDIDKDKAIACGCSDFISKPYRKEELLAMILKYLNSH